MSLCITPWKNVPVVIDEYDPKVHSCGEKCKNFVNSDGIEEPILPVSSRGIDTLINTEKKHQEFLSDLLYFQTSCHHPMMKNIIQYMMKLKCEATQAKIETVELQQFISKHSEIIFKDLASDLYDIIKTSPKLKKKLEAYKEDSNNVEIKELLENLECLNNHSSTFQSKSLSDEWIWVIPHGESLIIDTDLVGLEKLQQELTILEKASQVSGSPNQFFLEIDRLRQQTQAVKKFKWSTALFKVGTMTWQTIKGIYYIVTLAKSAAPTMIFLAPLILPLHWLRCVQVLLKVLTP